MIVPQTLARLEALDDLNRLRVTKMLCEDKKPFRPGKVRKASADCVGSDYLRLCRLAERQRYRLAFVHQLGFELKALIQSLVLKRPVAKGILAFL